MVTKMQVMTDKIKNMLVALYEEIKDHFLRIRKKFTKIINIFFKEGVPALRIMDALIAVWICIRWPLIGIGFAVANFVDPENTVTGTISGALAFAVLSVVSWWTMEVIAILAMFQIGIMSRKWWKRYELKERQKRAILA